MLARGALRLSVGVKPLGRSRAVTSSTTQRAAVALRHGNGNGQARGEHVAGKAAARAVAIVGLFGAFVSVNVDSTKWRYTPISTSTIPIRASALCEPAAATEKKCGVLPNEEHRLISLDASQFANLASKPEDINYVIFHGNCPDGFAAAYAAYLKIGDTDKAGNKIEYIGISHGAAKAIPNDM
jgi:hypothetical protein